MIALARLSPEEVRDGLAGGTILLIDVREPVEFAEARIDGALLFPMSLFDPRELPDADGKQIVFSCKSGGRSQSAFARAAAAGLSPHGHLEGGIRAWIAAGLAVVMTDPETGAARLEGN